MAVPRTLKWITSNLAYALLLALVVTALTVAGQRPVGWDDGPDGPEPTALPYCGDSDSGGKSFVDREPPSLVKSTILVSTLDGRITALDSSNGSQLWSHATGNGDLLSSTIDRHEFSNQGKQVRLVPSLDGVLYTFDGQNMGAAMASVDSLLSNSLKMSDDTVVTGGKEFHTYAIDLTTGLLRYSCGVDKCQYFNSTPTLKDDDDDVLLLNLLTKTVRAVNARNGSEKWNYSVGQHEAKMAPSTLPDPGCHRTGSGDRFQITPDQIRPDVRFIPSDGIVMVPSGDGSNDNAWVHRFKTPIVHAWSVVGREVRALDLFDYIHKPRKDAASAEEDEELPRPILFLGNYLDQMYIMESRNMRKNIPLEYKSFEIDLRSAPPRAIWQPYLFTAHSRTPTIWGRRPPHDLALISHVGSEESTALVISHNGVEYPFDDGFYLYPSKSLNVNAIDVDFAQPKIEPAPESLNQIVIDSVWHWWKEVLVTSTALAIVLNICVKMLLKNFAKENSDNLTVVEPVTPAPIQSDTIALRNPLSDLQSHASSESTASMSTPSTEFSSRYLNDFEPVHILGKGGFGVVFHARNKIDDCEYAIKRICMPNRNECKERIMREVKALAKLDHAGIVRYYNSWLECPPPHWQERIDRQWSSSGEGFLTPSASMTMDELQRAYGLRSVKCGTRRGERSAARPPGSSSSSPSIVFTDAEPCVRNRKNATDCDLNSTWSDLPEGDNVDDSESSSDYDADSLKVPRKQAEDSNDSYIVFAAESQEAGMGNEGDVSNVTSGVSSLTDGQSAASHRGGGDVDAESSAAAVTPLKEIRKLAGNTPPLSPFVFEKPDRLYLYIQMQLCRKDSLKDWLSANTESRNKLEILDFFDQIMSAVEYVHVQGLMHRDLKPSNIFFALDGTIKVGDFGLVAATMTPGVNIAEAGQTPPVPVSPAASGDVRHTNQVGTMLYMSPEQIAGENYDHKVDIFSMGLIFFEMLVPFTTAMERVKIMSEVRKLKFPVNFVNEHSVEHSLVATMLTHVPTARPSATEVKRHSLLQDFQPRPELLRWNRRTRTASRTFSTSSSGSGGIDIQFLDGSGDSLCEQSILNATTSSSSDTSTSNAIGSSTKLSLDVAHSIS